MIETFITNHLKRLSPFVGFRLGILLAAIALTALTASFARYGSRAAAATASRQANRQAAPIYGVTLPPGYREWTLVSVARVGAPVNDMRAKLGNDIAIRSFREEKLPFPDGTIIARLAWKQATSEENNNAVGREALARGLSPAAVQKLLNESFVAGPPINVQFMVKDSKKYVSTGGWGFAQFTDGKADGEAVHKTCFSCHAPAKDRDFVFTRYSP